MGPLTFTLSSDVTSISSKSTRSPFTPCIVLLLLDVANTWAPRSAYSLHDVGKTR